MSAFTRTEYRSPQNQLTDGSYTEVLGSRIDTHGWGARWIGYVVGAPSNNYAVLAKLQARIDVDDDGDWVDLRAFDETGTQHASTVVTVGANTRKYLLVTPDGVEGAHQCFREYRIVVKTDTTATFARVRGFAK